MPPVGKDEQSDALRQAARTNDVDKLKSLLAKGADANTASVRLAGVFESILCGRGHALF